MSEIGMADHCIHYNGDRVVRGGNVPVIPTQVTFRVRLPTARKRTRRTFRVLGSAVTHWANDEDDQRQPLFEQFRQIP